MKSMPHVKTTYLGQTAKLSEEEREEKQFSNHTAFLKVRKVGVIILPSEK